MHAELLGQLERITASGIRMIAAPEVTTHFVFERDGCVVLVERRGHGFGAVGSPGLLAEKGGFAALVRRDGADWFISKHVERRAEGGEAAAARRLFTDLKGALAKP